MLKNLVCLSLVTVASVVAGCATTAHHSGSVAMKITDTEAHVGLGAGQVTPGDEVELFKNICTNPATSGQENRLGSGTGRRTCYKESRGRGTVAEVLGKDYSVVKFPEGTKFSEGDIVEKLSH